MTDRSGAYAHAADSDPRIEVGFATDVGRVRTGNEDSVLCEPIESLLAAERGIFCAVADGMGGHAAGEDASSMAVKVARDAFYAADRLDPADAIKIAVDEANAAVFDAGAGTTGRDHMGSTLTAAVLGRTRVVVGHVGDSRCYVVQEGAIRQLTRDHSWVAEEVQAGRMTPEQARVNPRRNIITRALGLRPEVEVDVYEAELEPHTIVVICSDGLHGLVTDEEILSHVRRLRPADAVDALVRLANSRGGPDNISVVVARVAGDGADEADTKPSFPALTDLMEPICQVPMTPSFAEPPADETHQPVAAAEAAALSDDHPTPPEGFTRPTLDDSSPVREPLPDPATPTTLRDPAREAPIPARDAPPLQEHPRSARPEDDVAPASTAEAAPRQRGGRGGGMALIVVLVLLVALGGAIGYLLFRLFGLAG